MIVLTLLCLALSVSAIPRHPEVQQADPEALPDSQIQQCSKLLDQYIGEYDRDRIKSALKNDQINAEDIGLVLCCIKDYFDTSINTFEYNCNQELDTLTAGTRPQDETLIAGPGGAPISPPPREPNRPEFTQSASDELRPSDYRGVPPPPPGSINQPPPPPGSIRHPGSFSSQSQFQGQYQGRPIQHQGQFGGIGSLLQNPFNVFQMVGLQNPSGARPGVAYAGPGTFAGQAPGGGSIACAGGICAGGPQRAPVGIPPYGSADYGYGGAASAAAGGAVLSDPSRGPPRTQGTVATFSTQNGVGGGIIASSDGRVTQFDSAGGVRRFPGNGVVLSDSTRDGSGGAQISTFHTGNGVGGGVVATSDGRVRHFDSVGSVVRRPGQAHVGGAVFSDGTGVQGSGIGVVSVNGNTRVVQLGGAGRREGQNRRFSDEAAVAATGTSQDTLSEGEVVNDVSGTAIRRVPSGNRFSSAPGTVAGGAVFSDGTGSQGSGIGVVSVNGSTRVVQLSGAGRREGQEPLFSDEAAVADSSQDTLNEGAAVNDVSGTTIRRVPSGIVISSAPGTVAGGFSSPGGQTTIVQRPGGSAVFSSSGKK